MENITNEGRSSALIQESLTSARDLLKGFDTLRIHKTAEKALGFCKELLDAGFYNELQQSVARNNPVLKKNKLNNEFAPNFISCPITLVRSSEQDLYREPMIVSTGQTYEKDYIMKHFEANGNTDPITRAKLVDGVLIANKNIKQAAADWLSRQPKLT